MTSEDLKKYWANFMVVFNKYWGIFSVAFKKYWTIFKDAFKSKWYVKVLTAIASLILLLPEPFGPTTEVIPCSKDNLVLSGKVLKPCICNDFNLKRSPLCAFRICPMNRQK